MERFGQLRCRRHCHQRIIRIPRNCLILRPHDLRSCGSHLARGLRRFALIVPRCRRLFGGGDLVTFDERVEPEEIDAFRFSVEEFLESALSIANLRGTDKIPHPIMGPLSAHGWLCMFGLHLSLHRKQAEKVGLLLAK